MFEGLRDPQLLNAYAYGRNNPLLYEDENGEWAHVAIGAGAGIAGQYAYDVYRNVQRDGLNARAFTSNLSDRKTYLTRAAQGALIAGTGGLAGAVTTNVVGQAAIVGGASGAIGAGGNYVLGEPITTQSLVVDSVVGGTTFGLGTTVSRVPGRLPNFGTQAFFIGKHTQQSAATLGVDASANYLSAILTDLTTQLRDIQSKLNKTEEKRDNDEQR